MKTKKINDLGYSLVEMIIVIGIIGILVGFSIGMLGYIKSANTRKTVNIISSTMKKNQVSSMSRGDGQVLYLYKLSDGYYVLSSSNPSVTLDTSGEKIAGASLSIYAVDNSGSSVLLDGTNTVDGTNTYVAIGYSKSGVYNSKTNISSLIISGTGSYTIKLAKDTGKHRVIE